MNTVAKLIIGLLVTIAGLAWYIWGAAFKPYLMVSSGVSSLTALGIIFVGSFGLLLILVGLFITWIELEDIKDMKSEKKRAAEAEEPEKLEKAPETKSAKKKK